MSASHVPSAVVSSGPAVDVADGSDADTGAPCLNAVGFLGSGMMASALMDGLVRQHVVAGPSSIWCSDVWEPARTACAAKGYHVSASNDGVLLCTVSSIKATRPLDAIILAVKPDKITAVCADITAATKGALVDVDSLVISLAAGVSLATLEQHLPHRRVIRVMPNIACVVGAAACGYTAGSATVDADHARVRQIFGAVGIVHEFQNEMLLNAVTGLSGSGPAYVFEFIEALADGGVRAGLPRHEALELAAQTVKGASEMVLTLSKHPAELKDQVCSPGGTTIAGVDELEKGAFRSSVISAVKAATRRSMQLGDVSEDDIVHKFNL